MGSLGDLASPELKYQSSRRKDAFWLEIVARNRKFAGHVALYCLVSKFGASQKSGFQKRGFGGCSPGTKTGTRVRSPKPPFYETALLSPNDKFARFLGSVMGTAMTNRRHEAAD